MPQINLSQEIIATLLDALSEAEDTRAEQSRYTRDGDEHESIALAIHQYREAAQVLREISDHVRNDGPLVSKRELALPAKTAVQQTRSKEYAAGAAYVIDLVNRAYKQAAA